MVKLVTCFWEDRVSYLKILEPGFRQTWAWVSDPLDATEITDTTTTDYSRFDMVDKDVAIHDFKLEKNKLNIPRLRYWLAATGRMKPEWHF